MEPTAVVLAYFDAWREADASALERLLDRGMRASGPLATVDGGSAHAQSLASSSALFEDITVEVMAVEGDTVLTWFTYHLQNGSRLTAANRCTVRGDRIVDVEVVFDPRTLIAATGSSTS